MAYKKQLEKTALPASPRPLFAFLLLACATSSAAAQSVEEEDLALVYGDKSNVSIATGSQQPLRRAPSVASVITAEDIKAMGAQTLDDVMETIPGVHVSRAFQSYHALYQIRGLGGSTTNPQVLMLQNGIQTSNLQNGDRSGPLASQMLENIERIEIIRGPGSALYGADAFMGVVNIVTKTAQSAPGTTVGTRLGSFHSRNAWVQHGGQYGAFDVAAYVQVARTDGNNQIVAADAATRLNRIFNNQTSLAPGPMNNQGNTIETQFDVGYDKWRLRSGFIQRSDVGTGAGVTATLDPVGRALVNHFNADLSWNDANFSENWGLGWTASFLRHSEEYAYQMYPPGTRFPAVVINDPTIAALLGIPVGSTASGVFTNGMIGMPGRWERESRLSGNATYNGFADHSIRLGAGHEDLDMYYVRTVKNFWLSANGTPVPTGAVIDYSVIQPHQLPHRRFNNYVYAQDEWNFTRDWALTTGIRSDHFSDAGHTTNPRVALVWDANYDLTAKLMYGQAFRAPSFNEQYGVNPSGNGNPNLIPERIRTMETAFSWQALQDTRLNLNLFRYLIDDAIRTVTQSGGVGLQFNNVGRLHGQGGELEMLWEASRTTMVTANFSWQATIDDSTNQDSGYAPRRHAFARSDWRMDSAWMLSSQLNWVADRRRVPGDTRPPVADYTTVDLTLHHTLGKGKWDFSGTIRNLFNASAFEPTLYTAAPASVPGYPTSLIPYDLPVAPRTVWLQATYTH